VVKSRAAVVAVISACALLVTLVVFDAAPVSAQPAPVPPPAPTGVFSALTYNVAGLPEPLSGSEPDINTPFISPLLNDYDLVLVQEDWQNPDPPIPGVSVYHDLLIADVEHPYLSDSMPVPLGTDPRRPSALLSDGLNRMSQFPFGTLTREMWPSCFGGIDPSDGGAADCLATKGFSVARTTLAPGVEVDVYNRHAEAGSTPADLAASAEDFEVLADYINANSAGRAVLVGGDYNLHSGEPVDGAVFDEFLADAGLTDVCEVVDCGADDERIDKFTFRSSAEITLEPLTHHFEVDKFVRPGDGEPLSDHDALAVDVRWTAQPETCKAPPFSDVAIDHPFCAQIARLVANGIANGYDDGTFQPGAGLTRQAAAAFLHRWADAPDNVAACASAPFPDVPADHPFCQEIAWMASEGVAEGYDDGTFRPEAPVSRQAMAAFMYRLAHPTGPRPLCGPPSPFTDVSWFDHDFCTEIKWFKEEGYTNGYDDGTFRPLDVVTRQAAAHFLYRYPENPPPAIP
jgi:hypothetical protein